jgi:hypothetical protein
MAELAGVLPGGQHDAPAALAVAGLIDDEHPVGVRPQVRVSAPQFQPPRVEGGAVPGRVVQEVMQPLAVGPGDQGGQLGEGLVALPRQQQPDEVVPHGGALGQAGKQIIEVAAEPVDRLRGRRGRLA